MRQCHAKFMSSDCVSLRPVAIQPSHAPLFTSASLSPTFPRIYCSTIVQFPLVSPLQRTVSAFRAHLSGKLHVTCIKILRNMFPRFLFMRNTHSAFYWKEIRCRKRSGLNLAPTSARELKKECLVIDSFLCMKKFILYCKIRNWHYGDRA